MATEKKVYVHYTLRDRGGDLSKKWYVEFKKDGRRLKLYRGINKFSTAEARRKAARKLIAELRSEQKRRTTKLEIAIWEYINVRKDNWAQKTYEQYRSCANVFIEFMGGRELTPDLAEEFCLRIRAGRHPTTYNRYISYLKQLLNATGYEFISADLQKVKATQTPARYFQKYQAQRLLRKLDEDLPEVGLFVRFIYYCFLRPNEIRQLRHCDILYEDWQIRVPSHVSKNRKTQMVIIPKPFVPYVKPLMQEPPGAYIFPNKKHDDQPLGKNHMYRKHKQALNELGFGSEYTLYSWKHTGAVMAAKAGVSVKEIQLQLRHHSLDQTDQYLRQMGVQDLSDLDRKFPEL